MKLYHYTLGIKLADIIQSAVINTSPVKPKWPEKAIAWLSQNHTFEMSALKIGLSHTGESQLLSLEQMSVHGKGIYRFAFDSETIPVEIMPWQLLKPRCKAKPKIIKRLIDRAVMAGSKPQEWCGSFDCIPVEAATLEFGNIDAKGVITWSPVCSETFRDIIKNSNSNIVSMTVDQANKQGLSVECSNELWSA